MSSAGQSPVEPFLRTLTESELFSSAACDQLLKQVPPNRRITAETLATYLVETDQLTEFQADRLLRGRRQGLKIGPYHLLCPIGRGGMGIVYLARCQDPEFFHHGRLVALKVLPPKKAGNDGRGLARFHRESYIGLKLPSHPNLTRTLHAGEAQGVHYLAMEYVPGTNLRQIVMSEGPLTVVQAASIFHEVAIGLHQAHLVGFVHRDLKPANITILPSGRPKILDFGFALMQGEAGQVDPSIIGGAGYTVGTMDYLAPEQAINAARVTPQADIYSLGCCLYFAATGSVLFPGGTAQEKIRAHRRKKPPSVLALRPDWPEEFAELIEECLEKRPGYRPQSLEMVADDLEEWAEPFREVAAQKINEQEKVWLNRAIQHWKETQTRNAGTEELVSLAGSVSGELPQPTLVTEPATQVADPPRWWERLVADLERLPVQHRLTRLLMVLFVAVTLLACLMLFSFGLLVGYLSQGE